MKTAKYFLQVSIAAITAAIACPSCSDTWDDHYDMQDNVASGTAGASLWENLQKDDQLAPFNRVLKACGYDVILASPQMYTVLAPVITDQEADEWIRIYEMEKALGRTGEQNAAIKEFVMNHIALYNHQVSSHTEDTVMMRNGKYMTLTSSAVNQSVSLADNVRMPSKNGMLYKLDGRLPFMRNVWESIQADSVGVHALDSVANFFRMFEEEYLDPVASVPGSIDSDGNQHYVDSVVVRYNKFFSSSSPINGYYRGAYIDSEDSLYYFLAPTNQVWKEKVEEYKKYFICAHDAIGAARLKAYRDSLMDLYAKTALIESSFFNIRRQDDPTFTDSICSTIWSGSGYEDYYGAYKFDKPFSAEGIFGGATYVEASNGRLYKTDNWKVDPRKTFIRPIKVEAEYSQYRTCDESKVMITTESQNNNEFKVSGSKYAVVTAFAPTGRYYQPSVTFDIPGTLSNCPYDIKVVFATPLASDALSEDVKNRQVTFALNYYVDESHGFLNTPKTLLSNRVVDGTKMDTVTVTTPNAPFIPKVCNFWSEADERVKLTVSMRLSTSQTVYSPRMAIDCIIFEPRLDEE